MANSNFLKAARDVIAGLFVPNVNSEKVGHIVLVDVLRLELQRGVSSPTMITTGLEFFLLRFKDLI